MRQQCLTRKRKGLSNQLASAGVTGLTSAVFLAEAGYEVTVVAAHVPGDESIEYTSPW